MRTAILVLPLPVMKEFPGNRGRVSNWFNSCRRRHCRIADKLLSRSGKRRFIILSSYEILVVVLLPVVTYGRPSSSTYETFTTALTLPTVQILVVDTRSKDGAFSTAGIKVIIVYQ
jgi:hypothetical protein